jgi:hypothetical protein
MTLSCSLLLMRVTLKVTPRNMVFRLWMAIIFCASSMTAERPCWDSRRHTESCVTMYSEKALKPVQNWLPDFSATCHYTKFGMASLPGTRTDRR